MKRIKQYWINGGAKEIKAWLVQLVISLIILIFALGVFKGSYDASNENIEERINRLEERQNKFDDYIKEMLERISKIEANQERILEILQNKYK